MRGLVLAVISLGHLVVTSYRAVPSQTDDTPFYTSTNEHVRAGGVAVSRDLLCPVCMKLHHRCTGWCDSSKLHYGDWIYVERYGFRQVNDVMNTTQLVKRHGHKLRIPILQHIDLFVETKKEEHLVGVKDLNVFKIEESYEQP